jgi:putative endonuclease
MDSIRASEAPDSGSIPDEATETIICMFYAYVIKSVHHDYLYKGHCEDLSIRMKQHNSGMTKSIVPFLPFELVYFEAFETRADAIKREKYFKTSAGRRFIKYKLAL